MFMARAAFVKDRSASRRIRQRLGRDGRQRGVLLAIPADETAQSFPDRDLWRVAQQPRRLGNVGVGDRNVAGLGGKILEARFDSKLFGELSHQVDERGGVGATQVEDLELDPKSTRL